MTYQPDYDTTVRTTTVVQKHDTMHVDGIDWCNYPFDAPEHVANLCCDEAGRLAEIEKQKEYLRLCEQCLEKKVLASNYGGWPRIWQRVISVGMASKWPYWRPRPTVVVMGVLGAEWIDWLSLTGAKIAEDDECKS